MLFVFWSPLQVVDDGEDKIVNVLSLLIFIKITVVFGSINFNIFLSNTSIVQIGDEDPKTEQECAFFFMVGSFSFLLQ